MKKTKTKHLGYLRRFSLVFCGLVLLATTLLAMFPAQQISADPVVSAATAASKAKTYCTLPDWGYTSDLFNAGVKDAPLSEVGACEIGYTDGILGKQVQASVACSGLKNLSGVSDNKGVYDKNGPKMLDACTGGFNQGLREFILNGTLNNPSPITSQESTSKADAYCTSEKYSTSPDTSFSPPASAFTGCEAGYTASISGLQGIDPINGGEACDKYKNNNGDTDVYNACQAGFLQGLREFEKTDGIVTPASPGNGNTSSAGATAGSTGSSSTNSGTQALTCDNQTPGLGWILCPVINLLAKLISGVDALINSELAVGTTGGSDQPDAIFADSNGTCSAGDACANYKTAWTNFRNIALGLMVVAGLIIVTSQALGMELLDAYTVRKTLPRLLVAALAITLSWPLMQFAVTLSNDLGFGVNDLLESPFPKTVVHLDFGSSLAAGAGIAVGYLTVGAFGILMFALSGALAVIVALLVLILRQVVIIVLIILAPLAIVAYILPNTQRIYKLWWESFSKALIMFPLIVALIAAGHIFAGVVSSRSTGFTDQIIGFVAYFAPYFLIPATFKFAGGALSTIGGGLHGRSQGIFGGIANKRKANTADRIKRARSGGIYRKDLGQFNRPFARNADGSRKTWSVGRALNKFGDYTLDADEVVPLKIGSTDLLGLKKKPGIPGFRRGAARDKAKIEHAEHAQTAKAAQEINPGYKGGRLLGGLVTGSEHDYLKGLSTENQDKVTEQFGGTDENGNRVWRAPSSYKERTQLANIMATSSDSEAREAGVELAAAAPLIEQYAQSADTKRVDPKMIGLMAAAQAGRLGIDDVVANHNHELHLGNKEKATHETTQLQDLLTPKRVSAARGHAIAYNDDGTAYNVYKEGASKVPGESGPMSEKAQNSAARISTPELAQVKSEDLEGEMAETWVAGASEVEMEWGTDARTGERRVQPVIENGHKVPKRNPQALARAREMQDRLKNIGTYKQGDSDVGVKLRGIWGRIGRDEAELEWGTSRGDQNDANAPIVRPGAPGTPGAPGAPGPEGSQ
jgi:hypothetical protein